MAHPPIPEDALRVAPVDGRKTLALQAAELRREVRVRVGRWFDRLLARAGVPSTIPIADRERGTVSWFGVEYELRSARGGTSATEPSFIVSKLPSRSEIGRVSLRARALRFSFTSSKRVDQRALRQVAAAWFDGAEVIAASSTSNEVQETPSAGAANTLSA